jgi:predicted RNase H-like HicB family nuclease
MSEIIISRIEPPYPFAAYAHVVELLTEDDGGGYLITFPDLPGCMSDGETGAEAVANAHDAFSVWMSARIHMGKPIQLPARRRPE